MHKDKKKEVTGKVLTDMPTDGAEAIIRIRKQTAYHLSGIKIRNIIQSNIEQLSERDKIEVLEYYTLFYSGGSGIRSMIMQHTKENNPSMYSTEKAHDDFVLDWIKNKILEIQIRVSNTIEHSTQPEGLPCLPLYAGKLKEIFNQLRKKKIVRSNDSDKFTALFNSNFVERVYWEHSIRGAKAGLFDLIERLTGKAITAKELKLYFRADVHDNWRDKAGSQTKLIDEILKDL